VERPPLSRSSNATLVTSWIGTTLVPLCGDVLAVVRANDPDLVLFTDVPVLVRENDPRSGDFNRP
jgi:hypothetical protein